MMRRPSMSRRRWRSPVVVALLVMTTISLIPTVTAAAKEKERKGPIYFGAVLALSGSFASIEQPSLQGLQAAVDVVNSQGGILGRKVKLVYANDDSTVSKVTLAAQTLLSKYKLAYLDAEVIPPFQKAILPYTNQRKIITIEPTAGTGLFTASANPYNFQAYPTAGPGQAAVAAIRKLASPEKPKLAILDNGTTGTLLAAHDEAGGTEALGGQVVYTAQISPTATSATVQVQAAKQAGANVFMVQTGGAVCTVITQAIETLQWNTVKVILSPACVAKSIMESVPSSMRTNVYALGQNSYLQDSKTGGPAAQLKGFVHDMLKYGPITDLGVATNWGYIVNIMKYAIDKAGTTSSPAVLKVLNHFDKTKLLPKQLYGLPNPGWSATVHSFANANLSSYWALLHPGTPKTGAYRGERLTVSRSTPT